jgi:hypothetical protein
MSTAFFAQHNDPRLAEVLHLLNPPQGYRLWHGGPGISECIQDVHHDEAIWVPNPQRYSIWNFVLHIAYWKHVVRQGLIGASGIPFPRNPENFPVPETPTSEDSWQADIALMVRENDLLVRAVQQMDPADLDREFPSGNRLIDQLFGIAMHDAYHVAQIQLMKRLYAERT